MLCLLVAAVGSAYISVVELSDCIKATGIHERVFKARSLYPHCAAVSKVSTTVTFNVTLQFQ